MFIVYGECGYHNVLYVESQDDEKFYLIASNGEQTSLPKTEKILAAWCIIDKSSASYPDILQEFCEQALDEIKMYNENTSRLLSILMEKR